MARRRAPERIVFDNAAGVGRKQRFEQVRLTRLFQAFQAHYGFSFAFCNPYSGHEKGAVEAGVGAVRRKLFVPRPSVWSIEGFSSRPPGRCLELADKDHYLKGEREAGLFDADRKALLPLPAKPFDVVRWERMRADKYGRVTVEGNTGIPPIRPTRDVRSSSASAPSRSRSSTRRAGASPCMSARTVRLFMFNGFKTG